ncbi:MAG TPA: hypothetical protein VKV25_02995 [Acidimicrobiales bacterium]|nr:hypothetical protein [Acidimicrobiales bacterium]
MTASRLGLGRRYWAARLRAWPPAPDSVDGYSLVLPVPGDLPAFLDLALRACAAQRADHRVETIVVPDRRTAAVTEVVGRHRATWVGPLRVVPLPPPERWLLPLLKSGSRNHGMQLIAGASAATGSHLVLHDADLVPRRADLLETQYEVARARRLACYGLSPVWDPWFAERGLRLAATWDLVAELGWLRSFSPHQHFAHDDELLGQVHTFDTTLLPQACTAADLIDHAGDPDTFVHFNYVITAYRLFQRHGRGFYDDRFLIFFVSLVTELLGSRHLARGVPHPDELAGALGREDGIVVFPSGDPGGERYAAFRSKLELLLSSTWLEAGAVTRARATVAAFDRHYGRSDS